MSPYRQPPVSEAPAIAETPARPTPCSPGTHKRVIDGINMCVACSVCGCRLNASREESDAAYYERLRFDREYLTVRLRFHGQRTGNGLMRGHWEGIWTKHVEPVDEGSARMMLLWALSVAVAFATVVLGLAQGERLTP